MYEDIVIVLELLHEVLFNEGRNESSKYPSF